MPLARNLQDDPEEELPACLRHMERGHHPDVRRFFLTFIVSNYRKIQEGASTGAVSGLRHYRGLRCREDLALLMISRNELEDGRPSLAMGVIVFLFVLGHHV